MQVLHAQALTLATQIYFMPITRSQVEMSAFNRKAELPYQLRSQDFQMAMQDVYDFFFDVNSHLVEKGLQRLDDMLRPAIMSGVISDMLTASFATHARSLTENRFFNGHPDLVVQGVYPNNSVKSGDELHFRRTASLVLNCY